MKEDVGSADGRSERVGPKVAPAPGDNALPARFGKNVFMNYAAQGLTALAAVVLTPILLHHLGKTTYGLWVVASGAVAYLELFEYRTPAGTPPRARRPGPSRRDGGEWRRCRSSRRAERRSVRGRCTRKSTRR